MGFVTADQMRQAEERAFAAGRSAEQLMDKAGRRLGRAVRGLFPRPGTAVAYVGKGNNGGDALVALQVLREAGWQVLVRSDRGGAELSGLPARKLEQLGQVWVLGKPLEARDCPRPLVLLDGLLGIGARGPLREPLAAMAAEMNDLRRAAGALVVAVDVPSGVDADRGEVHPGAVVADVTLTIGVPKQGLVADAATDHVGRLGLVPLEELPVPDKGDQLLVPDLLRPRLPLRRFGQHKGESGRVGIIAGSKGMLGAALLTSLGALRGGAGLVTLYVRPRSYPLVLSLGPPPELMVRTVDCYSDVLEEDLDVLAFGPGLGKPGKRRRAELLEVLDEFEGPVVLDADGLNLAAAEGPRDILRETMVVTPHPGEFRRLLPKAKDLGRAAAARRFVETYPCTLLLKGARTIVTAPNKPLHYNSTGTPGMATGGQGDVLTGIIAALLAQGMPPLEAAGTGAWLAGRASEIALATWGHSEQSLLASDTIAALGSAFRELGGRTAG